MSWQFSICIRRSFWSSSSAKGASGRLVLTACITAGIASSRKRLLFVKWMTSAIPKIASWATFVFWVYGRTGLSECAQVICYRNLFGRLDLQEVTRNQQYGHVPHKLAHISVALGPQLVLIVSASHGSVKQHVLNHGRKKTNLILCHQDFRIP